MGRFIRLDLPQILLVVLDEQVLDEAVAADAARRAALHPQAVLEAEGLAAVEAGRLSKERHTKIS